MDGTNFDCVICHDKLHDAHETLCCHQCYCQKCITDWMTRSKTCPSCRKAITKKSVAQNVPVQRLVDNLPAQCPHFKRGCKAKLTRGDVGAHLTKCPYAYVRCGKNCGAKIRRYKYSDHLAQDCPKRVVPCKYCKLNFMHEQLENHLSECLKFPVACKSCGATTTREKRDEHSKNVCPVRPITCPFSKFGCTFVGKRVDYHNHKADDHVALAEKFFTEQNAKKVAQAVQAAKALSQSRAPAAAKSRVAKPKSPAKPTMVTRSSTRSRGKENRVNK